MDVGDFILFIIALFYPFSKSIALLFCLRWNQINQFPFEAQNNMNFHILDSTHLIINKTLLLWHIKK